MTRAYSEDLRTRVVGAVDAGAQPTAHHRTDIAGESLSRPRLRRGDGAWGRVDASAGERGIMPMEKGTG